MGPTQTRDKVTEAIAFANRLSTFLGAMNPQGKAERATVNEAKLALSQLNTSLWRLWLWLGPDGQKFQDAAAAAELARQQQGE